MLGFGEQLVYYLYHKLTVGSAQTVVRISFVSQDKFRWHVHMDRFFTKIM